MTDTRLVAPFPYFGGKRFAAAEIWSRLGEVDNYVEPFAGSLAVLLARPHEITPSHVETVNDIDGYIVNFWRSVKLSPDQTAEWADWPVTEHDLEARHYWLVTEGRERLAGLLGDPDGHDPKVAGWWCWGACAWIAQGWCYGDGPWRWTAADGWVKEDAGRGINRNLPHLGAGQSINRKLPHLGAGGAAYTTQRTGAIYAWFAKLSDRLRRTRVCAGDWSRICTNIPVFGSVPGATRIGVVLDPPYSATDRSPVYNHDSHTVSVEARRWAVEMGADSRLRIAFCGYAGEFDDPWPEDWTEWRWRGKGGYSNQSGENANAHRERVWFSPHCLSPTQADLFA